MDLTEKIDAKTGGISAGLNSMVKKGEDEPLMYFTMGGKATSDKLGDMLELIMDVAKNTDFSDKGRFL